MKYITLLFGLLFFSVLSADGHLKSEKDVLVALQEYFEARNSQDYKTVIALESKSGTYGTNSDGSFRKPKQISSVEQWKRSGQGGVTKVFYPKAIQLSEDVVYVRFYAEGMSTDFIGFRCAMSRGGGKKENSNGEKWSKGKVGQKN